jgi:hypothetical protein
MDGSHHAPGSAQLFRSAFGIRQDEKVTCPVNVALSGDLMAFDNPAPSLIPNRAQDRYPARQAEARPLLLPDHFEIPKGRT